MRTPVSRRRVRAAVFASPLLVAALWAPSSALADPPVVAISPPTVSVNPGVSVTLTASAPGDARPMTWTWDTNGDGLYTDGSGATIDVNFAARGPHVVSVHGTTPDIPLVPADPIAGTPEIPAITGGTGTATATVTVNNLPPSTPTVTFTPAMPSAGKPITFTATSTDPENDALTYDWTFGPGDVVLNGGAQITHALPPGTPTVTVTAHDGNGGTSAAGSTGAFLVVNQPPHAKVSVSPNPVGVGKPVTLSSTGSFDPEGLPLTYAWDLGLGTGFDAVFGTATTRTVTYDSPGTKSVGLRVKDQYGLIDPDVASVTVTARQPPAPNFVFSPVNPMVGDEVTFTSTTASGESPITNLDWDVDGDGTFTDAAGSSIKAVFNFAGPHTVSLRATDTDGVVATAQQVVNVTAQPGTSPGTNTGTGSVTATPTGATTSSNSKIKAKAALISPFPTVRIRGVIIGSKVKVSLLSVTSKVGVTIKVFCSGKGCPKKAQTKTTKKGGVIRFSALKRTLGNGAILRIYVSKKGQIGKYTRFRIQKGKAPVRVDMCLPANGSSKPRTCPLPK